MNNSQAKPSTIELIASKLTAPADPAEHLLWLVDGELTHSPHYLDGAMWAARPQAWWCDRIGISERTLRRYLKKPPFQTLVAHVYGVKTTLIRVGKPLPPTKRLVQRHLMNIWRKRVKAPSAKDYGLMAGLVDAWGLELAPSILHLVIDKWPAFMAGAKIEIEKLGTKGHIKYFTHPALSVIRRFAPVGAELYLMQQQEEVAVKSFPLSPAQQASHPITWK